MPRDPELLVRMQTTSPVITRQTTMWNAWIGFNASHGCGLILFGCVYAFLTLAHRQILFHSIFLLALGFAVQIAYIVLAKKYFFRIPLGGVTLAASLYVLGLIAAWG